MHHQLNTYTAYTVPIYTYAHKVSEWARERENGNVDDDDDDDDDGEGAHRVLKNHHFANSIPRSRYAQT